MSRRVSVVNHKPLTSPMRGYCIADLNPRAALSELCGGIAAAGQQQRTTGLRVHQQLQQGR